MPGEAADAMEHPVATRRSELLKNPIDFFGCEILVALRILTLFGDSGKKILHAVLFEHDPEDQLQYLMVTVVGGLGNPGSPKVGHECSGGVRINPAGIFGTTVLLQPRSESVTENLVLLQGAGATVRAFRAGFKSSPDVGKTEPSPIDELFGLRYLHHQFSFGFDGGNLLDSGEKFGSGFLCYRLFCNGLIHTFIGFGSQGFLFALAADWINVH